MLTTLLLALQCLKYQYLMVQEPDDVVHSTIIIQWAKVDVLENLSNIPHTDFTGISDIFWK
jgi:hypothetical protein